MVDLQLLEAPERFVFDDGLSLFQGWNKTNLGRPKEREGRKMDRKCFVSNIDVVICCFVEIKD